jgi:PPOX class probable F420-dependent enzyme
VPKGPAPERFHDLLTGKALGHLATVGPHGKPQVNPVWFISDGSTIALSILADTVKYRNLRANPAVAMSILDPATASRYLEMRGEVIEFELYETLEWVNHLARKYTGAEFTGGSDGQQRYKVVVRVESWTGQES